MDCKKNKNSEELSTEELNKIADKTKREFIKKFGKYAVTAPAGMLLLMSAGTSKAHARSDCDPRKWPPCDFFSWKHKR